ncbi:MAG: hypothetical protein IJC76_09820 [Lachnospiraceae bacterium]|nr:hypothetical protein [Lachnospiraceae bacterium]
MKKIKNVIKRFCIIGCLYMMCFINTGCTSTEGKLEVYGGEIVKNSTLSYSEKYLSYELPIISSQKIKDFKINEYIISGNGSFDIKYKDLTGGEKYKDWYYYFANIEVKIDSDIDTEISVDSIDMSINGNSINYEVADLNFSNTKAVLGNDIDVEKRSFVYDMEKVYLYQYIPENKQIIALDIQEDCTITGFKIIDFVDIENLVTKVNDTEKNLDEGIVVKKGDKVTFEYNLKYKENVSKNNLIKTTSYITYLEENNKDCAFIDEQGIMIINYMNDQFVKDYIDNDIIAENN